MQNKAKILDKFSDLEGRTVKKVLEDRYKCYVCLRFEDGSCCILISTHDPTIGEYVGLHTDVKNWHYEMLYDLGFMSVDEYENLTAKDRATAEADMKEIRRERWEELNKEFGRPED